MPWVWNSFDPPEKKFLTKINKLGPVHPTIKTRCWIWMGSKGKSGYGKFYVNKNNQMMLAHRFAFSVDRNFDPDKCVLHKCDVPSCVRYSHLFQGTLKQNSRDMVMKGRHRSTRKTHCKNGHPFNAKNTYIQKSGRRCRTCFLESCKALRKSQGEEGRRRRNKGEIIRYWRNHDKILQYQRSYRKENRNKIRAYAREYRRKRKFEFSNA